MPNPLTLNNFPKTSLHVFALAVLAVLLASLAITGCVQQDTHKGRNGALPIQATNNPTVTARKLVVEDSTPTANEIYPTQAIPPTVTAKPTRTPYPTYTPFPTQIHAQIAIFTPKPIPDQPQEPTPTPLRTPVRPSVSGYLLIVNGAYVLPNEVSILIDNGYIMVSPMTGEDGSYPKGTQVTLGYYPNRATDQASWSGVDSTDGPVAKVFMDRDREVIAAINP